MGRCTWRQQFLERNKGQKRKWRERKELSLLELCGSTLSVPHVLTVRSYCNLPLLGDFVSCKSKVRQWSKFSWSGVTLKGDKWSKWCVNGLRAGSRLCFLPGSFLPTSDVNLYPEAWGEFLENSLASFIAGSFFPRPEIGHVLVLWWWRTKPVTCS